MSTEAPSEPISLEKFHHDLATELFRHVCDLLEKPDRTCAENDRMIHAAHASRFHFDLGGTPSNVAIGEWQCSRVHCALRQQDAALYHAWRALETAEAYQLGPFHLAYAHEALARAFALNDPAAMEKHLASAREISAGIEDEGARAMLEKDLAAVAAPRAA
jgi:hypothetical protein